MPLFIWRAVGVGFAWTLGALPVAFGLMRCPIAAIFHTPCPGCGMTRALTLLAHGDVARSLAMHPLALPALVASALVMFATTWATLRRGAPIDLLRGRSGKIAAWSFVVVQTLVVLLWIARAFGGFGGPVSVAG